MESPFGCDVLAKANAEIERLKGVISSNQPNGKWLDQYGGCRVCGGEIPHGHSAECDYWKLEQQIADSKKFADDVAAAVNGWEYGTRNAYMRDLLIGQIADLRQQLADLTAKLAEAERQLSAATAANVERDRAFEAMEAIKSGKVRRVYESDAGRFRAVNCNVRGYYADNPTAAILAAKAAGSGTNTGEK